MSDLFRALRAELAPRYTLRRELGGGGMSRVFLATELALGRDVAIKVVGSDLSSDGAERFAREMRLAARLQHPNIVPVLTAGEAGGLAYYTMPFVRGESLRVALDSGALTRAGAQRILADVARALAHAHGAGVVHRDIKPENVLLADGVAVVTDFGIARALDAARPNGSGATLTQAGMAIGTPAYMAPEQVVGDPALDGRADLYALGVLAFELLTGRHPFADRRTAQQLVVAHLTETPESLERIDAALAAVAPLVMRCLAKAPEDRPADAMEVVRAFEATPVIEGRRVEAKPITATPTVAVLPFTNLSRDPDNEYLSDGITDEVLGTLGRARGLRVAGRASCFALKGRGLDARAVGEQLGVTAVVDGSVRRMGSRIRVSAELLDAATGFQLWSERYDRETDDLFALQDEIAAAIASALTTTLTTAHAPAPSRERALDPEAYNLYLQGYHLCRNQLSADNYARAEELIDRSIALDGGFARAHLARAVLFMHRAMFGFGTPRVVLEQARRSARDALRLDDSSAEGWMIEAQCAYLLDHDWSEADRCIDKALELDPRDAYVLARAAQVRALRGRHEESLRMTRAALVMDPLTLTVQTHCINELRILGQLEEAARNARTLLERHPDHALAHVVLSLTFIQAGRREEARPHAVRCAELAPDSAVGAQQRAILCAWDGDEAGYQETIARMQQWAREGRGVTVWMVGALQEHGDIDQALDWIEHFVESHDYWYPNVLVEPLYHAAIRSHPRFLAVLERVKGAKW